MRCGYVEYEGEQVWIPGCQEAAIHGEGHCSCYKSIFKGKRAEQEIDNLEQECRYLRQVNAELNKKNQKLVAENNNLRRQGLPIKLRHILEGDKFILLHFLENLRKEAQASLTAYPTGPSITAKPEYRKK